MNLEGKWKPSRRRRRGGGVSGYEQPFSDYREEIRFIHQHNINKGYSNSNFFFQS